MASNAKIFDIYVRNITVIGGDKRKTADTLKLFINKQIIRQGLDSRLGLVDHLKVPEMCKEHDGTTYIAFCRMERTDRHSEAVGFLNTLTFEGRKLLAKFNEIESGAAQWSTKTLVGEDNKPIWYHREKAKYLQVTNQILESQERLIAHIERRLNEEKGKRQAAEDELRKTRETIRHLEDTVKELKEVLAIYEPSG